MVGSWKKYLEIRLLIQIIFDPLIEDDKMNKTIKKILKILLVVLFFLFISACVDSQTGMNIFNKLSGTPTPPPCTDKGWSTIHEIGNEIIVVQGKVNSGLVFEYNGLSDADIQRLEELKQQIQNVEIDVCTENSREMLIRGIGELQECVKNVDNKKDLKDLYIIYLQTIYEASLDIRSQGFDFGVLPIR